MNFDIANLVLNIGQQSHNFEWGSFFTALFGAFFGAGSAYLFSQKQEFDKIRRANFDKLKFLVCLLLDVCGSLLLYKTEILEKKLEALKNNNWPRATLKCLNSEPKLTINIEDYSFLTDSAHIIYQMIMETKNNLYKFDKALKSHDNYVNKFIDKDVETSLTQTEQAHVASLITACKEASDFSLFFSANLINLLLEYMNKFPYKNYKMSISELSPEYKKYLVSSTDYPSLKTFEAEIEKFRHLPKTPRKTIYKDLKYIYFNLFNFILYLTPNCIYKLIKRIKMEKIK